MYLGRDAGGQGTSHPLARRSASWWPSLALGRCSPSLPGFSGLPFAWGHSSASQGLFCCPFTFTLGWRWRGRESSGGSGVSRRKELWSPPSLPACRAHAQVGCSPRELGGEVLLEGAGRSPELDGQAELRAPHPRRQLPGLRARGTPAERLPGQDFSSKSSQGESGQGTGSMAFH